MAKKYVSLNRLSTFLDNLKNIFATKTDINTALSSKANSSHTHSISDTTNLQSTLDGKVPTSRTVNGKALTANISLSASDVGAAPSTHEHSDKYYGKSEVDSKLNGKSDTTHNHDSDYADIDHNHDGVYATAGHNHDAKYEPKGTASSAVSTHNTNTTAHADIRDLITGLTTRLNTLANSDDTTLDQMSEIVAYIKANKALIDSVTTSKVNVADIVNNLTTNVTNKPLSAAQGVAIKGLIDALQSSLNTHDANTTKHITSTERTNWNAAKTHADSAHAPSNAQPNQNAFSNIKVGTTTIAADTTTDTLTLAGTNVTITPDTTNDKVTIAVADATTSAKGVVQLTDSVTSTSTITAATPKNVKAAYDLANTAKTTADGKQAAITGGASTITSSNLTASRALVSNSSGKVAVSAVTSTELGYLDGVTSNVQTQLDSKLSTSGGTISGIITTTDGDVVNRNNATSGTYFYGGTDFNDGAFLGLYGKDQSNYSGQFRLKAEDGENFVYLEGRPDGTLKWGGKDILRSDSDISFTNRAIYGKLPVANGGTGLMGVTYNNFLVGNGNSTLIQKTPAEVLSMINGASVATMTTAEYEALSADEVNANTLYMLTDADEEQPTQVQIITWESDD